MVDDKRKSANKGLDVYVIYEDGIRCRLWVDEISLSSPLHDRGGSRKTKHNHYSDPLTNDKNKQNKRKKMKDVLNVDITS